MPMKITNVETIYIKEKKIEKRTDGSQDALLVKITTDSGIIGWGEVDSCPVVAEAIINAPYSHKLCLLYTSPSPRDKRQSRMPSSA